MRQSENDETTVAGGSRKESSASPTDPDLDDGGESLHVYTLQAPKTPGESSPAIYDQDRKETQGNDNDNRNNNGNWTSVYSEFVTRTCGENVANLSLNDLQ